MADINLFWAFTQHRELSTVVLSVEMNVGPPHVIITITRDADPETEALVRSFASEKIGADWAIMVRRQLAWSKPTLDDHVREIVREAIAADRSSRGE